MSNISRRTALATGAAAITTGAITAPLTAKAAPANDDHIAALYADWRAAEATWIKVNAVADNAQMDALRACGEYPVEGDYTSEAELEAAWDARRTASKAAHVRHDVVELKARADVASAAESDALHRFIEAQAEGPRGVMIKVTAFIEEIEVVGMDDRMLVTIRNDLERLAKTV